MTRFGGNILCLSACIAAFCSSVSAESGPVVDTSRSPLAKLRPVDVTSVRLTEGFWADRFRMVRDETLPLLYELAADPERGAIQNLEIAAGRRQGTYTGNNWMDAWIYKWIEAAAVVQAATKDDALNRRMDELIAIIAEAQEADGYLATQNTVRGRPRFQVPNDHEVYTMGHLLTAACVHHRMTGKDSLLAVARKTADFLAEQYKGKNPKMAHFPYNPSVIMGAVELYRVTGERRYLDLANTVIDMRGAFPKGSDQTQDRTLLRNEMQVYGHAVFYTYLFAGAADAYLETGDRTLWAALNRLWEDLARHKLYITGGTCAQYRGVAVRDGQIYRADVVHEAVGAKYELPKSPAYNETCGQVGNLMWNWRMLAVEPDAKYADMMEREMYNGVLSAIGVGGRSFTYSNPLRWYGDEHELWGPDSPLRHLPADPKPHQPGSRYGTCCPSNVLRTLAEIQSYFYSTGTNSLWIHQYGSNTFDDGTWKIEQETNYSWGGSVELKVEKAPEEGTIRLRIPPWASGYELRVNGADAHTGKAAGTYVALSRKWKTGDTIALHLPMKVRLMRAHRKVDSTHNQIAIMRGPLVYCLESPDLPDGVDVSEIIVPRATQWEAQLEPNLLGGVVTLTGRVLRLPKNDAALYTELVDEQPTPIDIKLIPYYAWKNRGVSQMTVWLSLDW